MLDIFTIIVLVSGVYLWRGKRHSPIEVDVREVERSSLDRAAPGAGPAVPLIVVRWL